GELYEELHRPGDAARAYKRLLAVAPDDSLRARALWGLARAYEAQKLWAPARDAYLQAQTRFADQRIEQIGPGPLRDLVAQKLAREPLARLAGDRSEPTVPVPLRRRWDRRWLDAAHPIAAEGVPPSA